MIKKRKKIFIIITILVVIGIFFGVGNYFYNFAINSTDSYEEAVFDDTTSPVIKINNDVLNNSIDWFKNISEEVQIKSKDNLELKGYEIKNNNDTNKWVIDIHGYKWTAKNMSLSIKKFYDLGFNVLAPDLRGHGKSDGDYIGMGYDDHYDILKWIDYIISNNKDAEIILYGQSMGGATVMLTTGEKLPKNVKVAIEDCGYTSVWSQLSFQLKEMYGLPEFPIMQSANLVTKIRAGYWLSDGRPIEAVAKSETPTLFIHGDADKYVPFEMLDELYSNASCEKEKLIIKDAGHCESERVDPELYWNTINEFINKYID